ncbi:hypothetical protein EJB05_04215, partial [Eragrostis curvula]
MASRVQHTRRSSKTKEAPPQPPPREPLPVDLQLEVVAHSDDAATILRCAAASKSLRGAILGPGFRPRRRRALRAAVDAGFGSGLARLVGVSDASRNKHGGGGASRSFRLDAKPLQSFEPVSSRDGLLVLWRRRDDGEEEPHLRVYNTFNGEVTDLPCMDVEGKWGAGGIYRPALLGVRRSGRPFDLLVMDACLRTRTYSSNTGKWGPIRVVKRPSAHNHWCVIEQAAVMRASPAVVGRRVHWICRSTRTGDTFILAVHVNAAEARSIELPPGCCRGDAIGSCTIAATADRKLGVVVAEAELISMWTLSSAAEGWCREVVIRKQQVTPDVDAANRSVWFVGFGKTTGTMLLWMEGVGLVQLNLATMEAIVCSERDKSGVVASVSLQEIDLVALIFVT